MSKNTTLTAVITLIVMLGMIVGMIPSAGYCGPVKGGCGDETVTVDDPKRDPEVPGAIPGGRYDPR